MTPYKREIRGDYPIDYRENFVSLERHKRALVSLFCAEKIVLTDTPIIIIVRSIAILQRGLYNLSRRFGLRCRIADNEVASHQLPREGKGLVLGGCSDMVVARLR